MQVFGSPTPIADFEEFQWAIYYYFAPAVGRQDAKWPIFDTDVAGDADSRWLRLFYGTWQNNFEVRFRCAVSHHNTFQDVYDWWHHQVFYRKPLPTNGATLGAYAEVLAFALSLYGPPAWSVNAYVQQSGPNGAYIAASAVPTGEDPNAVSFSYAGTEQGYTWFDSYDNNPDAWSRPLSATNDVGTPRYEATFEDIAGRSQRVPFSCRNNAAALQLANAVAGYSGARWTGLTKVSQVVVDTIDDTGAPLVTAYRRPAGDGSDVQRKAFLGWDAAGADDTIRLELPSVAAELGAPGDDAGDVDPLDDTTRAYLTTENGAPATAFRGVTFGRRVRSGA